ncbi:conserved hypothetical protein [Vibrio crassostreae]|nr:conserved hypothetical protein [Vibrio crassostreae]
MTLCVTYITDSGKAVSLTDSLLTTTQKSPDKGAFLPSDQEIVHQTPFAVKFHNISGVRAYSGRTIDILTAIAGNVSLGLQCTLHIETYLKFGYTLWYNDIKNAIEDKVLDFWCDARDKQIQMSFALFDHKLNPQLIECRADDTGNIYFQSIKSENGFALSVLGDGSEEVKAQILNKINTLQYQYEDFDTAIHIACVSVLQENINDSSKIFIGGNIQGGRLNKYDGEYLVIDYGDNLFFRGTKLDCYDNLELPIMDMSDSLYTIAKNA